MSGRSCASWLGAIGDEKATPSVAGDFQPEKVGGVAAGGDVGFDDAGGAVVGDDLLGYAGGLPCLEQVGFLLDDEVEIGSVARV